MAHDTTGQETQLQALQPGSPGERRWQAFFEQAADVIFTLGADARITSVNRAACDTLGYEAAELIGTSLMQYLSPESRPTAEAALHRALSDGSLNRLQVEAVTRSGRAVMLEVSGRTIRGPNDTVESFHIARDVTESIPARQAEGEQRALAAALRDSAAALNASLNVEDVLDRVVAHVGPVVPSDLVDIMLVQSGVARIARHRGYSERNLDTWALSLRMIVADTPTLRQMARTGQPILVPDTQADAGWVRMPEVDWVRSYVAAPIQARGRLIGFLNLNSTRAEFYTQAHVDHLMAFANQAALALDNAHLFDAEREQATLAEALRDTAAVLNSTLDFEEVLDRVLANVGQVVPHDAATVLLIENGVAQVAGSRGYAELGLGDWVHHMQLDPSTAPTLRHMLSTGQALAVPDVQALPGWIDFPETAWVRSFAGAPIHAEGQVIGFLNLVIATPDFYTEAHARRLQIFADQAAAAIQNARLFDVAQRRLSEQVALLATSTAVASSLDLPTIRSRLAEQAGRAIDATSAYISDWDPGTRLAKVVAEYFGPDALAVERESDLGVGYPVREHVEGHEDWLESGEVLIEQADDTRLPAWFREHMARYGAKSAVNVPLIVKGTVVGLLELWESRRRREFTHDEIALCRAIAQQAAIAFENARLLDAQRKRGEELEAIYRASLSLTASLDLPHVLNAILDGVSRLVAPQGAHIFLYDGEHLRFGAATLAGQQAASPVAEPRPAGLTYTVARTGEALIVEDTSRHPLFDHARDGWAPFAIAGLPLRIGSTVIGVMNIAYDAPHRFAESDVRLLQLLAAQAAIAVHNAALHEQVQRHAAELEERVAERTAEVQRQHLRMQAILDGIGEGILFTDRDGSIEYVNPAMESITGYRAPELRGQNPRLFQSGHTPHRVHRTMWSEILQGRTWRGEVINRRRDGTTYTAALTVAPLTTPGGGLAGFVGVQRDITRQKELDRMKDLFVSNVSHELRTPLANVKLYLGLLDHGRADKRAQYMQTLHRETARLEKLINDLLDLSRLDMGTTPIYLVPTDINQLVGELILDRAALAAERGLSLDCQPEPRLPPALADPAMTAQVMSNLMANAINYTPAGGIVTITTGLRRDDDQEWVTFTVHDTGPGLSEDDVPHLFERFYRGSAGRRSGAPGTGLGLAICKEIVERLEGHISVEAPAGQGGAFTIWLKVAPEYLAA